MKKNKAYMIAIKAIKKQRQPYAIGANLYQMDLEGISVERDFKAYSELTEAIKFFEEELGFEVEDA